MVRRSILASGPLAGDRLAGTVPLATLLMLDDELRRRVMPDRAAGTPPRAETPRDA